MPQRVKEIGTIPTTTGLPGHADYWPKVQRNVIGPEQTLWSVYFDLEALGIPIPAESEITLPLYTVPSGFDLYTAAIYATCDGSVIQTTTLYDNGTAFASSNFDVNTTFTPDSVGVYVLTAGHILSGGLANNDVFPRYFRFFISGILQKV